MPTRDCCKVLQPGCQGPNAVKARSPEHKAAQLIAVANHHVQATIRFAVGHAKSAGIGARAFHDLHALIGDTLAALPITHAQRPGSRAIKHAVVRPQVQIRVVEQHPHRDAAQLATGRSRCRDLSGCRRHPHPHLVFERTLASGGGHRRIPFFLSLGRR